MPYLYGAASTTGLETCLNFQDRSQSFNGNMREKLHAPFTLNPEMILPLFWGRLQDSPLPSQAIQYIEFQHVLYNLGTAAWRAEWTNSNCLEVCQRAPAICDAFQNGKMLKVPGCF